MKDFLRESLSYGPLYRKMWSVKKIVQPQAVSFGPHKEQYFLYYEPKKPAAEQIILWVHGGGWNAGSPRDFDFVGQCAAREGYRLLSLGYRLAPKYKYPCQIEDVCAGYRAALCFLRQKGLDCSRLVLSGPSAGAHLASILCYSKKVQQQYNVDVSNVVGFIGSGGPYRFSEKQSFAVKLLLEQLFAKGYDRTQAEPYALMTESRIPMLLIQSKHDGLIDYSCAEDFHAKAQSLNIPCELYTVEDSKNTHSWYTAGMFLETRAENRGLDRFFTWVGNL